MRPGDRPMPDVDLFDPDRWGMNADPVQTSVPAVKPPLSSPRRTGRFLRGPVPWCWLLQAMQLPGKALAVGLMLWLQSGMTGSRTVLFCLTRAAADGIPTTTA